MDHELRAELDALKQVCADTQKEVQKLASIMKTRAKSASDFSASVSDRLHQLDAINHDFQTRLLNVEEHCFPGIKAGHEAVAKLIGTPEDEEYSRFDYRSRFE